MHFLQDFVLSRFSTVRLPPSLRMDHTANGARPQGIIRACGGIDYDSDHCIIKQSCSSLIFNESPCGLINEVLRISHVVHFLVTGIHINVDIEGRSITGMVQKSKSTRSQSV